MIFKTITILLLTLLLLNTLTEHQHMLIHHLVIAEENTLHIILDVDKVFEIIYNFFLGWS